MSENLGDCSTGEFYCLRTSTFEVVLPRRCRPIVVGDVWRVGNTETRVLYHDTSVVLPRTYLGNPNRKTIVYLYGGAGVGTIFWDLREEADLVAMASAGSLERWLQSLSDSRRAQIYHVLITNDAFGQCR